MSFMPLESLCSLSDAVSIAHHPACALQVMTWSCNVTVQPEPILRFTAPVDQYVASSRRAYAGNTLPNTYAPHFGCSSLHTLLIIYAPHDIRSPIRTLLISDAPHCICSSLHTLRITNAPHYTRSALRTLLITYAPHYKRSSLHTLLTSHTLLNTYPPHYMRSSTHTLPVTACAVHDHDVPGLKASRDS